MQNATKEQMKMLLTRIGEGSKIVVTGDLKQHDRGYNTNGLKDFIDRLKTTSVEHIALAELNNEDILRHPAVAKVLELYDITA
jgi:phosphate starvation-inducible PhoH-like protein